MEESGWELIPLFHERQAKHVFDLYLYEKPEDWNTMGSSASKSTRKLPTTTPSTTRPAPSWAGALPAHPPHSPPPPPPAAPAAAAAIISNNAGPSTAARGSDSPPLEYGRRMEAQGAAPISGKSPARFSGEKDDGGFSFGDLHYVMDGFSQLVLTYTSSFTKRFSRSAIRF